jgi:hypothetical protein
VPHFGAAVLLAGGLAFSVGRINRAIPQQIEAMGLAPVKVILAPSAAAVLAAMWGYFGSREARLTAEWANCRPFLAYLPPAFVLMLVSIAADLYRSLFDSQEQAAVAVSVGTLGASVIVLLGFAAACARYALGREARSRG